MLDNRRILQIAHSHPRYHPGGTEITALALHREAINKGFDSWYLGALNQGQVSAKPGTNIIALTTDNREAAIFDHEFDVFRLSQPNNFGFIDSFQDYLSLTRPDIVHIHHVLSFGLEALYAIRTTLPDAKIVFTLHDYYLICANRGQLFKRDTQERCDGPELHQCMQCLPKREAREFELRALDIQHALSLCDHMVSPSWLLKEKFERHLKLATKIDVIENGYIGPTSRAPERIAGEREGRVTFGYFGNISIIKGLADLLDAADLLQKRRPGQFNLIVNGSQLLKEQSIHERMTAAKSSLGHQIRYMGMYRQDNVGRLMSEIDCLVFPSLWWENAPLVIYEALYNGCPVISYPHGGAAEILRRYDVGVMANGTNPEALANAMQRVLDDPELLRKQSAHVPDISKLLLSYAAVYIKPAAKSAESKIGGLHQS